MASSDRNLDVVAFVTDHFRDIVRRRLSELAGLALITCALLGVIALRVDGKLEWDAAKGRFTNNAASNKFLKPTYRKGWTLS